MARYTGPKVRLSRRVGVAIADLPKHTQTDRIKVAPGMHGYRGRRMRDYGAFDDPDAPQTALLVECGQHWEAGAAPLARAVTARFLSASGALPPEFAEAHGGAAAAQSFFTVTEAVTITSEEGFRFAESYTGGEVIAEAGTLIGHDGDRPVRTPLPDMMLVMPSKRLWQGQTAVRLATRDSGR